jgi:hypothetical protein
MTSTYGLISWMLSRADSALGLPLQVGLVHDVEVDDAERADAGGGQVQQRGRAETAGPDHQHLGVLQPLLPGHAHVGDDEVARVPLDLVHAEPVSWLDQGGQRHRVSRHRVSRHSALHQNSVLHQMVAIAAPWGRRLT